MNPEPTKSAVIKYRKILLKYLHHYKYENLAVADVVNKLLVKFDNLFEDVIE